MKYRFECVDHKSGEIWFQGVSVTHEHPCPICRKPTRHDRREGYCAIDRARGVVWCGHASDAFHKAFYRLSDSEKLDMPVSVRRKERPVADIDWESLLERMQLDLKPARLAHEAEVLGVSEWSLKSLDAGWDMDTESMAFPMRNAAGVTVGIRLRKPSGFKFAVAGSSNALFIPNTLDLSLVDSLVIVEGPTDAAAAIDLGMNPIGRASALTCTKDLVQICRGKSVSIFEEADEAGMKGARGLADALVDECPFVSVVRPLRSKDVRSWLKQGATPALARSVINNGDRWTRRIA